MRQLFSWRFVAAAIALVAAVIIARALFTGATPLGIVDEAEPIERSIDLIAPIEMALTTAEFEVQPDGSTAGFIDLILDSERVVRVVPGTLGEVTCDDIGRRNRCALFADMLGEAVIWFAVLPQSPRSTVELPPVVDLDGGDAVFGNGWRIPYAAVIERDCPGEDIATFSDFLRRFGPDSVTVVDLDTRRVVSVRCAAAT